MDYYLIEKLKSIHYTFLYKEGFISRQIPTLACDREKQDTLG